VIRGLDPRTQPNSRRILHAHLGGRVKRPAMTEPGGLCCAAR